MVIVITFQVNLLISIFRFRGLLIWACCWRDCSPLLSLEVVWDLESFILDGFLFELNHWVGIALIFLSLPNKITRLLPKTSSALILSFRVLLYHFSVADIDLLAVSQLVVPALSFTRLYLRCEKVDLLNWVGANGATLSVVYAS